MKSNYEARCDLVCLSCLPVGAEFLIGNEIYMILEHSGTGGSKVIRKEPLGNPNVFGISADWKESKIREYLNGEYYEHISGIVGRENIIEFSRDLTSLDGLEDYGTCVDNVSMLTVPEYNTFGGLFGERYPHRYWLWTITPFSTPRNDYHRLVCCIDHYGDLCWHDCSRHFDAHPVLYLNSSLLVADIGSIDHIRELVEAEKEKRLRIIPVRKYHTCGTCQNFVSTEGKTYGTCKVRNSVLYQSRKACSKEYMPREAESDVAE